MSIQPTDIAILLISAAACIYCIVLNRRLKALQDTKDGLGASIVAFSKSVSDMSQTTQQTRTHAGQIASRLAELISEANTASERLQKLSNSFEGKEGMIERISVEGAEMCERIEALSRDLDGKAITRFEEMIRSAETDFARIKLQYETLHAEHSERFDDALSQAETSCDWIEEKIQSADTRLSDSLQNIQSSQDKFDTEMRQVFTECAKQVADMTTLASQIRSLTNRSKFNFEEALQRSEKSVLLSSPNIRVDS